MVAALKSEAQALAGQRAARPRHGAGYAALALAAAAISMVGTRWLAGHHRGPPAASLTFVGSVGETVARGGASPRKLRSGESLTSDPGEVESAEPGSAELVNSAGLGLRLGSATRVSLSGLVGAEPRNQVELRHGLLTCTVPHLNEGQRFSVATPDALVVVHGTVFSVRVDSQRTSGSETCVRVTDGVVIVQHGDSETALNAGDSWGCAPSIDGAPKPADAAASAASSDNNGAAAEPNRGAFHGPVRAVEHGTLGEENRLFQAALAAERLGQKDKAELGLNRLLSKYPGSPLAPEARRALSRIAGTLAGP